MHLAFEVESMEEFQKHLDSIGVELSDGPTESSSGSIFAFVDAPEGYEIEIIERPKYGIVSTSVLRNICYASNSCILSNLPRIISISIFCC